MDALIVQMVKALVLVPVTLLPIINPLSTAPIFAATVRGDAALSARLARQVAINSWVVIVVSILIGTYVLAIFGISLPVVRVGGGLLVAATAWRMLHHVENDEVRSAAIAETSEIPHSEIVRRSFFPITFPMTTGPGTIAASIALGAQLPSTPALYLAGAGVAAAGAALVALTLYFLFKHAGAVMAKLGEVGMLVMTKLMAFMLLCIGIQIMWDGWAQLNAIGK